MAGNALMIHSSIVINTDEGQREIQLCFGDVTSTSTQRCLEDVDENGDVGRSFTREEVHDVLLISAYQGNPFL